MGASYVHNHTLTHTNTFSQTHICSRAFCALAHSLKHRGKLTHAVAHTHTRTQTWGVCGGGRGLWALWGHMMVGGRFERAYLRIDRAADCSCAEMIYISRNTHTFWSLYPQTCAWVCETQVHVIAAEFHMTWILDCKTNLHICTRRSLNDVSRLLPLFSHSVHKKHLLCSLHVCRCSLLNISKANLKRISDQWRIFF